MSHRLYPNGFLEIACDVHGCDRQEADFLGNRTVDQMIVAAIDRGWYKTGAGVLKCPNCRTEERKERGCKKP